MVALSVYKERLKDVLVGNKSEIIQIQRHLARTDLYYLLRYVLNKAHMEHQWIFDRCYEVQQEPYNTLDIWAREHMKSSVITFGKNIQDILASHGDNPLPHFEGREVTIGIFSHTRSVAKGFLREIKFEFEDNQFLKDLFPDILYSNPEKQSQKWSEDEGIIVKRQSNQKEATVEAWGLVDGMPTGKHYYILNYDDIVTDKSVTTSEMIKKTTDALMLSYNLGSRGGYKRVIGTYYHFNDTLRQLVKIGNYKLRFYPATDDGKMDGTPVLLTQDQFDAKRNESISSYVFSCQILLNPIEDGAQTFNIEDLNYCPTDIDTSKMNIYILVDPASEKKRGSDYTAMVVIGLGIDQNYYILDGLRDRLNLTERWENLLKLHEKWSPIGVGYEKYSMQADIEFFKIKQKEITYNFAITPLGGNMAKVDRVKRLVGPMESGKIYVKQKITKKDYEGRLYNFVETLVNELEEFPVSEHDDVIDIVSRIVDPDMGARFPKNAKTAGMLKNTNKYDPLDW